MVIFQSELFVFNQDGTYLCGSGYRCWYFLLLDLFDSHLLSVSLLGWRDTVKICCENAHLLQETATRDGGSIPLQKRPVLKIKS